MADETRGITIPIKKDGTVEIARWAIDGPVLHFEYSDGTKEDVVISMIKGFRAIREDN